MVGLPQPAAGALAGAAFVMAACAAGPSATGVRMSTACGTVPGGSCTRAVRSRKAATWPGGETRRGGLRAGGAGGRMTERPVRDAGAERGKAGAEGPASAGGAVPMKGKGGMNVCKSGGTCPEAVVLAGWRAGRSLREIAVEL